MNLPVQQWGDAGGSIALMPDGRFKAELRLREIRQVLVGYGRIYRRAIATSFGDLSALILLHTDALKPDAKSAPLPLRSLALPS